MGSKQQWDVDPRCDLGFFDGSAEPNPGGTLGLGWHLILRDGRTHEGSLQQPPHPDNTNNVGEYRAFIALLRDYRTLDTTGPLCVHGDSQLVINQVFADWAVNAPNLWSYWRMATELIDRFRADGIQVTGRHIPRERNRYADQLASGKAPRDPATFARSLTQMPDVRPDLARAIAAAAKDGNLSFKQAMRLRVGGRDTASALHQDELEAQTGPDCVAVVTASFPDPADVKARESALRWCLRGLPAQLACRKVEVDLEVSAKSLEARKGRGR
jgi:ribonuclease HI